MEVSRHAQKRLKERLGLNRKAAIRHAEKAFKEGICPKDYYFSQVGQKFALKQEKTTDQMFLFFKDYLYVFGTNAEKQPVLITVYDPLHEGWGRQYVGGQLTKIKNIGANIRGRA